MQHRPAILTTTQHNFNPTIFWEGGHQPLPTMFNPTNLFFFFTKNIFGQLTTTQQHFNPTIFFWGGVIYPPPGLTLLRTIFALTYVFLIVKTPTQPQHNLTQPEESRPPPTQPY